MDKILVQIVFTCKEKDKSKIVDFLKVIVPDYQPIVIPHKVCCRDLDTDIELIFDNLMKGNLKIPCSVDLLYFIYVNGIPKTIKESFDIIH